MANLIQNAYLIAKYVRDLDRMEPINIGVMLWANGMVKMRFMDVDEADFIEEPDNYARWLTHWQSLSKQTKVQVGRARPVTRRTPKFLDAIYSTQSGNYLLDKGGSISDEVSPGDEDDAVGFLFDRLVSRVRRKYESPDTFSTQCRSILESLGIANSDRFVNDYSLPVAFGTSTLPIHFSYAIAGDGGSPRALFQRVQIRQQQSVTSGAFKFESAIKTNVEKQMCFAMYAASDDELESGDVPNNLGLISNFAIPLNIYDLIDASNKLRPARTLV